MALINTAIRGSELIVTAQGSQCHTALPLTPRCPKFDTSLISSEEFLSTLQTTQDTVHLFRSDIRPLIFPKDKSTFFAEFLELPLAQLELVYIGPDPREIRINKPPSSAQGGGVINTAFADSAPYLLASEESLDDVNDKLPDSKKVEMVRFRPNIVVAGTREPWDEENWKEISIGHAGKFFVVARCPRCQLPKYL
jgi:uncharacterized protein YcbX